MNGVVHILPSLTNRAVRCKPAVRRCESRIARPRRTRHSRTRTLRYANELRRSARERRPSFHRARVCAAHRRTAQGRDFY
ncbi:hypothetical protein C7S17_1651 [Burkholderia thailandensis]|nr:hypothetical protein [Burkholderia thailandensis]